MTTHTWTPTFTSLIQRSSSTLTLVAYVAWAWVKSELDSFYHYIEWTVLWSGCLPASEAWVLLTRNFRQVSETILTQDMSAGQSLRIIEMRSVLQTDTTLYCLPRCFSNCWHSVVMPSSCKYIAATCWSGFTLHESLDYKPKV